jgi:Ca2+-binding EF-hand superfamily protein
MSKFVPGAALVSALFASAAIGQTSPTTSLSPKAAQTRHSFFTSNQARADVPAHVARLFNHLDVNHDGFVARDEIASSQAQFDERLSKSRAKRAAGMFDRLDANHDGQITRAEFDAEWGASGKPHSAKHRAASSSLFVRGDANKDGVITRAEYDAAVDSGKLKLRHANMRGTVIVRLFDAADVNRDGRVSLEEAQHAALQHFDAADLNHDGTLTPDERRQASKAGRAKRPGS